MYRATIAIAMTLALAACSGEESSETAGSRVASQTMESMQLASHPAHKLVKAKCGSCHYLDRYLRKVGPSLKGIYGKKPTITGVPYESWDDAALHAWLEDPKKVKPSTFMAIPGIKEKDRRDQIIDYLKQL